MQGIIPRGMVKYNLCVMDGLAILVIATFKKF